MKKKKETNFMNHTLEKLEKLEKLELEKFNQGELITIDKSFTHEEIIPANNLRTMSQKSLVELLTKIDKIGLIVNNEPEIAMMKWQRFSQMVDTIHILKNRVIELENLLDDMYLVNKYGENLVAAESGKTNVYEIENIDDVFNLMDTE